MVTGVDVEWMNLGSSGCDEVSNDSEKRDGGDRSGTSSTVSL